MPILLIFLLTISSCLVKQTNPSPRGEQSLTLPQSELKTVVCPHSDQFEQERGYFEEAEELITQAWRASGEGEDSFELGTPDAPMITSWADLDRLKEEIRAALNDQEEQRDRLSLLAQELSRKLVRWKHYLCLGAELPNARHVDTRAFLHYQQGERSTRSAIRLCESFEDRARCRAQAHVYSRGERTEDFIRQWAQRFQRERYGELFQLRETTERLGCVVSDIHEIVIPIKRNASFDRLLGENWRQALDQVEGFWRGEALRVRLRGEQEGVELVAVEEGLSYVNHAEAQTIYLQTNLTYQNKIKVLAHELGHLLGFPDCYQEFLDPETEELIYFEHQRDSENLMCTIEYGTQVPESYFEQLKAHHCH